MTTHNRLMPGKSNRITLMESESQKFIQKVFAEKLTGYDVYWPITRKSVERLSHKKVADLCRNQNTFHQPAILNEPDDSFTLTMEYIDSPTLMQILTWDSPSEVSHRMILPSEEEFTILIRLLHSINRLVPADFNTSEQALLAKQAEITACMYHNKLNDTVPVLYREPQYFCLGDVSLNNILFDGKAFTLLDFECAHMGYQGYDIGQLLGMMAAYASESTRASACYSTLQRALSTALPEEEQANVYQWAALFKKYYLSGFCSPS